jgi:hypothetical protein
MNNTLWLLTFTKVGKIEVKEIEYIQEHTIKYELPKEHPYDIYNYIHKHNFDKVNIRKGTTEHEKTWYIVSDSKEKIIQAFEEYVSKKIVSYKIAIQGLRKHMIELCDYK